VTEGHRPLIFGEVLFDFMPDGTRVLGGAPFNVAWHLEAFGLRPLMITRLGRDESGDEVLAAMEAWGMDTSGVQRDDTFPTGRVQVDLEGGEPTFHIVPDQAYDHIDSDRAARSASGGTYSVLYHGSLIARGKVSSAALDDLTSSLSVPVFVDVNLRNPWWNRQDVLASMSGARWAKLNQAELDVLAGDSDVDSPEGFRMRQGLDALIVTRGSRGAMVVDQGGVFESPPPTDVEVVDTVGAGDAFSSVFILGLVKEWPMEMRLQRALDFAAAMCTVSGATVRDRSFYSSFNEEGW
jgi:fructokinase